MIKRFVALIMAFAMVATISMSAFAVDNTSAVDADVTDSDFIPLEESEVTREYALALLELTEEEAEAEGIRFYVNTIDPTSVNSTITVSSGSQVQIDQLTVSGTTSYGNKIVVDGTRICWACGCVYKSGSSTCYAELQKYSGKYFYGALTLGPNNTQASHEFVDIDKNSTMQFMYTVPSGTSVIFVSVVGVSG